VQGLRDIAGRGRTGVVQVRREYSQCPKPKDLIAKRDFIPSLGAPPYLLNNATIEGQQALSQYGGLKIDGSSRGPLWIVRTQYIPQGWVLCCCDGRPQQPEQRGFRTPARETPPIRGSEPFQGRFRDIRFKTRFGHVASELGPVTVGPQ
jgi:hypothetical protein